MAGSGREWGIKRAAKSIKFTGFLCAHSTAITTHLRNAPTKAAAPEAASPDAERSLTKPGGVCVICLEALIPGGGGGADGRQAIFTSQCNHSFHFTCIASLVDHGGVTCPICRARWAQLPRHVPLLPHHQQAAADPALFAPDGDHRRHPILYDDDDAVEPVLAAAPRFQISIVSVLPMLLAGHVPSIGYPYVHPRRLAGPPGMPSPQTSATSPALHEGIWLSAKLSHQPATDVVLVASAGGPHLQALRQSMALVVFSIRPVDRLAIITCLTATAVRALPLKRMTAHGRREALQAIDSMFYLGEADPVDGLRKGVKVLEDRAHRNPLSCILHLCPSSTMDCARQELQAPFPVHHLRVPSSFGAAARCAAHQFEEFLSRLFGGVAREIRLRIGEGGRTVVLGEMRGGKERRIALALAYGGRLLRIGYSYIEGVEERLKTGEVVVSTGEKSKRINGMLEGGRRDLGIHGHHLEPFTNGRWNTHLNESTA